jgi:3',5'-cyclic AMP phosphodiesterase CpdA
MVTIDFEATSFDTAFAFLSTAYEPLIDEILLTTTTMDYSEDHWRLVATVPSYTPEELYNITVVVHSDEGYIYSTNPRAVSVIDHYTDTFSFIHITDLHVGDPRGLAENVEQTIGMKSIKKCIEEINLLHPEFVIISGDLVFGQLYPFEYSREYKLCYDILQQFDVPTYLVPGNHDGYNRFREDGLAFWQRYFGPLYYSFDFGNYHFLGVNSYDWSAQDRLTILFAPLNWGGSIREEQLTWIEQDLAATTASHRFMFLHHNPIWDTKKDSLLHKGYYNRENLLSLINQYDIEMVLAGHIHADNVSYQNDILFITTTTPESEIGPEDGYWGYRCIEITNGSITKYNYKEPKYSIPSYRLNYSLWQSTNLAIATIENDLDQDLVAHFTFTVPLGTYTVDHGEIIMQRHDYNRTEIYVETPIARQSILNVTLTPSPS